MVVNESQRSASKVTPQAVPLELQARPGCLAKAAVALCW